MREFQRYEQLRDEGKSPLEIYWAAKADKVDPSTFIRLLRSLFNLSLPQARDVIEQGDKQEFTQHIARYEKMRDDGASAQQVYLSAKSEGLDAISRFKLIRVVFNLPLAEVKEISLVADGLADSLDDFQSNLAGELNKALKKAAEPTE